MSYPADIPVKKGAEPLFTIRAQDSLAIPAIDAYIAECEAHGLDVQADTARETREKVRRWQAENPKHTHLPSYSGKLPETI